MIKEQSMIGYGNMDLSKGIQERKYSFSCWTTFLEVENYNLEVFRSHMLKASDSRRTYAVSNVVHVLGSSKE